MTKRERANRDVYCGQYPIRRGGEVKPEGCGARDWQVFSSALLNRAAGEALLVCQNCGAECLVTNC